MNHLDEARNGLKGIPAKLPANVLDPTAMRSKPRLAARALQVVCRLLAYNAALCAATGDVCPVCVEPIRRGWRPIRLIDLYQLGQSVTVTAASPAGSGAAPSGCEGPSAASFGAIKSSCMPTHVQ